MPQPLSFSPSFGISTFPQRFLHGLSQVKISILLAEIHLLDFSGSGRRQGIKEHNSFGHLHRTELLPAYGDDIRFSEFSGTPGNDENCNGLAPLFVRKPDNCCRSHPQVRKDSLLDLDGGNILTTCFDDIFFPIDCMSSNGFGQIGSKTKRGFQHPYKTFPAYSERIKV
jgi:hypothetical protein